MRASNVPQHLHTAYDASLIAMFLSNVNFKVPVDRVCYALCDIVLFGHMREIQNCCHRLDQGCSQAQNI